MSYLCPEGHETVYASFSGGKEWYCATCGDNGYYDYESIPVEERPRAWLLTQPGGAEQLRAELGLDIGSEVD